jgi:quercetin dioxygenase-like cupin family protein
MREWWSRILKGPIPAGLAVTTVVVIATVRFAPRGNEPAEPGFHPARGSLPEGEGENITARVLARHESASVHRLRVREAVRAHYHRVHDETVVVLSGEGRVRIGEEWRDVEPGLVLVMPRGVPHELVVTGEPVEAVSIFSPAFDGRDRVYLDD